MTYTPRVIAPIGNALSKYFKPWLSPEDSFTDLEDVYLRRGVIHKRNGFILFGRIPSLNTTAAVNVGSITTVGMTAANPMVVTTTDPVSGNPKAHGLLTGQRIWLDSITSTGGQSDANFSSLNNSWYEVNKTGANTFTITGGQPTHNVSRNDWPVQIIDGTSLGTYTASTAVIYPSIVGLLTYSVINGPDLLIAFDQINAFVYNPSTSLFVIMNDSGGGPEVWTGRNWELFSGVNFSKLLWVTNFNDPVAYSDGSVWTFFTPSVDGTNNIYKARVVVAFKGRLIFLNTAEGSSAGSTTSYPNRARWSWGGDPTNAVSFRADLNNGAGFADAATDEDIVSVALNGDDLIVFFENSVWNLKYTQNDILPFIWQTVNVQYGCASTNATVSLDQQIVTVGTRGFIGASSSTVQRIDLQVPEQFTDIESSLITGNSSNFRRTAAVQNFDLQQVIWAYPEEQPDGASMTSVLRAHVRNNKAAVYNYQENTWSLYNVNWTVLCNFRTLNEKTWGNTSTTWGDASWTWGTSFASVDKIVLLAGSDSGRVFETSDVYTQQIDDTGATVSFGFNVQTKRYNSFIEMGQRCRVEYIDLYLDAASGAELTVDVYVDDNDNDPVVTRTVTAASANDTIKRVYVGASGRNIQFNIYLTDEEIESTPGQAPFGLQGIIVWTSAAGRLVL